MANKKEISYLVAMDSFKGSLSSDRAADAVKEGILRANPNAKVIIRPLADGGEGTVKALTYGMGGTMQSIKVSGPMGNIIDCEYGIVSVYKQDDSVTQINNAYELYAVIEIAGACGLYLVPENKRNPLFTTTYGVGEVILDALNKGCRKFIIGLGGSSTNDGGMGMLEALGVRFLDKEGKQVSRGADGLKTLHKIDISKMNCDLAKCEFMVACDVDNPLCGENGCSRVFAPQKGADDKAIEMMDRWLERYANMTADALGNEHLKISDKNYKGVGAAGGLGFAFRAYFGANLRSGIDLIIDETGIADLIKKVDVIITGEGCLDGQSAMGKAPVGLARAVKKHDSSKRVVALAGRIGEGAEKCTEQGIDEYYGITDYVHYDDISLYMDEKNAYNNLSELAEKYVGEV